MALVEKLQKEITKEREDYVKHTTVSFTHTSQSAQSALNHLEDWCRVEMAKAVSFTHTSQSAQSALNHLDNGELRRFCAITPYKYTPQLCRATRYNNDPVVWIEARVGTSLVGIAMLQWATPSDIIVLQHILIQPEYQRKGIGTDLLRYIVTHSNRVVLSVPDDAHLARFYTKRGFQYVFTAAMLRQHFGMPPDPKDTSYFGGMMSTDAVPFKEAMSLGRRFGM